MHDPHDVYTHTDEHTISQAHTHAQLKPTWFCAYTLIEYTKTHTSVSNHHSRLLSSPTAHAMSVRFLSSPTGLCWRLASLTGALKLTAWFVLQHKHARHHQLPRYGLETPGNARDCVFYTFRLSCYEFNISLKSTLFICWWWLSFYTLATERDRQLAVALWSVLR